LVNVKENNATAFNPSVKVIVGFINFYLENTNEHISDPITIPPYTIEPKVPY